MQTLHAHGPGHGHAHPAAPATEGKLIRWARFYDPLVWLITLGQPRRLRALPLDLAALRPGERVREIGCGTGAVTLPAARRVGPDGLAVGIDPAPEMIAEARRKARRARSRAQFRLEPAEALSFPAGSFDVVLSSLMMHHLPGDLKPRALAEVRRVLRPGGRVVIVDMLPGAAPMRYWHTGGLMAMMHRRHAPTSLPEAAGLPELAAFLRDAGFIAVETGPSRSPLMGYARGQVPEH
jgi:demethylmenaquinone methyltransferase/2-methoxy-6-polyprenyl-1,4-benzoquinol methylase/phosphoethanolamine N-methyltransferase